MSEHFPSSYFSRIDDMHELQADLRQAFARKARHALDELESVPPDRIVEKSLKLKFYFSLYRDIDMADRLIDELLTEREEYFAFLPDVKNTGRSRYLKLQELMGRFL